MSSPRLGPTSYLILGMVALRGPSTPYEIKRAVGRSVGRFWPFPHSQFYDEPARLAAAGLLSEERETEGRRRRTYTITERGLDALRAWLREPTAELMEIRDIGELKLFFSELVTVEDVVALARAQEQAYRRMVAELEALAARFTDRPDLAPRMAPLALGLAVYRAALDFWRRVAEHPSRPEAPRSNG